MSKIKKTCAYKGCNPNNSNNETYFSFPSDSARCQLWKDLSQTELAVPKYLCSKHFDRKKYISENPRRNILLHTAVPYPYENSEEIPKDLIEPVENLMQLESNTITYEEEQHPNSAITYEEQQSLNITKDDFIEIPNENHDLNDKNLIEYDDKVIKTDLKSIVVEPCKRKSNLVMPITVKIKKVQNIDSVHSNLVISKNNSIYKEKAESIVKTDESTTTNDSDSQITTFIFKGEEYIQMPKSLYLKEKSDLEKKVQHYANIVFGIHNFLEQESEYKE